MRPDHNAYGVSLTGQYEELPTPANLESNPDGYGYHIAEAIYDTRRHMNQRSRP